MAGCCARPARCPYVEFRVESGQRRRQMIAIAPDELRGLPVELDEGHEPGGRAAAAGIGDRRLGRRLERMPQRPPVDAGRPLRVVDLRNRVPGLKHRQALPVDDHRRRRRQRSPQVPGMAAHPRSDRRSALRRAASARRRESRSVWGGPGSRSGRPGTGRRRGQEEAGPVTRSRSGSNGAFSSSKRISATRGVPEKSASGLPPGNGPPGLVDLPHFRRGARSIITTPYEEDKP